MIGHVAHDSKYFCDVKGDKSGDFIGFEKIISGLDIQLDSVSPDMQVIVGFELSSENWHQIFQKSGVSDIKRIY